jgi:hypothetical protein
VILATPEEATIRRITVKNQFQANSPRESISKKPSHTHTHIHKRLAEWLK